MLDRVLHLIDPEAMGWGGLAAAGAFGSDARGSVSHDFIVLSGSRAVQEQADRAGLRALGSIGVPGGFAPPAAAALRRVIATVPGYDVIGCWGAAALVVASLAAPRVERAAILTAPPRMRGSPIARFEMMRRFKDAAINTRIVLADSDATCAQWVNASPALVSRAVVVPTPLSLAARDPVERARERERWGIDDSRLLVASLGEPPEAVDAFEFSYRCGVLAVAGLSLAGLVHPRAFQVERALRFAERHLGLWSLILEDRRPVEVLHACDVAMWIDDDPSRPLGVSGLRAAAALEVPIIASDTPHARAALGGYSRVSYVSPRPARLFARAALGVLDHAREKPSVQEPAIAPDPAQWVRTFHDAMRQGACTA